jgi:hypothetical protein
MRTLSFFTVLGVGVLSLTFYSTINYILFKDFGFLPAGRIVFTSDFGYLDYLILPLGILVGIAILRRKQETMSFRYLLRFGLKTTLLASVLFSAFIFVYLKFIEPHYFPKLIGLVKQLETSETVLTPVKREMLIRVKTMEESKVCTNAGFYGIANFFAYLTIGTVSTFLFATFLRRKQQLSL